MTTAEDVIMAARRTRATLALAESCTGGLLASALTAVAGASDVFDRGFVTYSNHAKREMLGVEQDALDLHGAVSEEIALQMARGALARSGTSLALSITGIAGPGGSGFKPEGRVCFGIATKRGATTETVEFGALGRTGVRAASVNYALDLLLAALAPPEP
ncbi:CinA family protein [Roseitranquillus sediminis]|uniref:CinA family protein n=1 Tax=Roseitranquillus sediminis TaxID=2809051 RepID=UPI001D0CC709|nr:CinA family protein [Roseitranquillus sediminis]MBM9595550.1 CinA family protein [Roseitranquillus sediminis]